ncbi:hypothetical protein RU08_18360 [Pseudomonas fulva]|uniref:Uncharacterized protein n=2 Tax=Pseudomonadaceae TaxID=135621 RepID=A0A0D0KES7_9PSED|nr:hypothetical protein RU08_18360 [Pseudomonas fulva]
MGRMAIMDLTWAVSWIHTLSKAMKKVKAGASDSLAQALFTLPRVPATVTGRHDRVAIEQP